MGNYLMIGLATMFAALGLLFLAISFGTDNWQEIRVDRDDLQELVDQGSPNSNTIMLSLADDPAYYSRNRGLFRTCFDDDPIFLDTPIYEDDIVDGNCLYQRGYEVDGEDIRVDNEDYDTRIHLMRAHVAFYIIAMILLLIALVCACVGCWKYSTRTCRAAAACCIAAVLLAAGGIAFFHGYEYLENEKINVPGFPRFDLQNDILDEQTKRTYGYSYILGWLGVVSALVAGILFICAAWSIRNKKIDKQEDKTPIQYQQPAYAAYQPQAQPQYVMTQPPAQVVTPVPSAYGGYGPSAQPVYGVVGYQ